MSRVKAWERRTEVPLLLLALAFLVSYAWPILDPRLDTDLITWLTILSWTTWAAFVIDFTIRLGLANDRARYAARHWYDVVLIVLPMFRTLRLLRLLVLVRFLGRSVSHTLANRVALYVVGAAVACVLLAGLAVLDAERGNPDANITTFGDAIWWACTTVTTVGYGDHFPTTGQGRVIAVGLMIVGIALVGSITAAIAAWFVEQSQRTSVEIDDEATQRVHDARDAQHSKR